MLKYRLVEQLGKVAALAWQAGVSMGADVPAAEGDEIRRRLEVLVVELKAGKAVGINGQR